MRDAEEKLSAILRAALAARAYEEVEAIASLSRRLRQLTDAMSGGYPLLAKEPGAHAAEPSPQYGAQSSQPRPKTPSRSRREKADYPKFVREGDRLVKIGWSKKDQAEYQHKAPRKILDGLVTALAPVGSEEFALDTLFPITDADGQEVPSYQAYLGLAWLRSWGAVRRESRGGYVVQPARLSSTAVAERWSQLPDLTQEEGHKDD